MREYGYLVLGKRRSFFPWILIKEDGTSSFLQVKIIFTARFKNTGSVSDKMDDISF